MFFNGAADDRVDMKLETIVAIALAIWTFFLFWNKNAPRKDGFSVVLDGEEKIHRAPESPDKLVTFIPGLPQVTTLYENYEFAAKSFKNNPLYGTRRISEGGEAGDYVWMTYWEANQQAKEFAGGLMKNDMIPVVDGMRMLALFSKNRTEWAIAEQAMFRQGGTTVPLYDTLGNDVLEYVINQTNLTSVLCAKSETEKLLKVAEKCETLKHIIQMEPPTEAEVASAKNFGISLTSFEAVRELGIKNPVEPTPPKPDDIATFCYTSGTTGMPKGVLLSHCNLVSALAGCVMRGIIVRDDDVHLSYLPLAHVMERLVQIVLVGAGARIGFFQGDTLKIVSDLAKLRPTVFPTVPRLLTRVYDKIIATASGSPVKKFMFNTALKLKTAHMKSTMSLTHWFWDRLVFDKISKKVGLDRCRVVITGSAPIDGKITEFMQAVFSLKMLEGYGQTETSAASTLTAPDDISNGHVGAPTPAVEIKLADVPDMDYLSTDTMHDDTPCAGRGEICFRGPAVFKGYYKLPDKTAEALDEDGWCHTGDIGIWLTGGQLMIVDRKKNMFKLSQGEYVAAEKIENVYSGCEMVGQVFVYGDSLKHYLVAIVVPNQHAVESWAKANGHGGESFEELVKLPELKAAVLKEMTTTGRAAKLNGFELAKAVHLTSEQFTAENNLLTPSFKLKRHDAKKKYKAEIDKLYAESSK